MEVEAARFAQQIAPHQGESAHATVVALQGDLGAGKTTFTQGIARALGVGESVTSPTFVIEKIYELTEQNFTRLIHIDAYRLTDAHELEVLGWHEVVADPLNLIIVEWPEHVAALIPENAIHISFAGTGDSREIIYG